MTKQDGIWTKMIVFDVEEYIKTSYDAIGCIGFKAYIIM